MASTKEQVSALLKKEYLLLIRSQNWILQELFSPIIGVYLIYHSTQNNELGLSLGPLAISLFQSRIMFGLMYGVVFEKSQNYKEYLRVNGASLFSYIFSTFLFYVIRAFIAATILYAGILYVGAGSGNLIDEILGYISLLIYSVAIINFSLALTTLFSSPKLATQAGSLVLLTLNCVYYAVVKSDNKFHYYLASLLPPVSGVFGISMASTNESNPANFTHFEAVVMQFFNCFFYFGLYVYLDKIVPSDSGIKDPIWKCFKTKQHSSSIKENELPSIDAGLSSRLLNQNTNGINQRRPLNSDVDDISSAMHHEPFHNPNSLKRTVFIENLTKKFGKNVAVDGATVSIFERQIFCLLGHNGAGKTTAINMMTGLLRPDGGGIYYDDEDFAGNFEQIRKKFGLCVQKDILYENLTAAEHLELISRLRGISVQNIPEYINFLSQKVGIENELTKKSNTLSGGNKRKLSLAMAISGDTKVIFLDEPTSGLDPNARRSFWDLVRLLRDEGKTILLTTHNLDEADELADRIAIMSKGKLLILGTSNFLKKKYGVGYNLILTPKPNTIQEFYIDKNRLIESVRSSIVNSELDFKTAPEMVKITLPYGESHKFPDLFHALEKEASIEVALELNTLEDVFVNIGLQHEALENQNTQTETYSESIPIPQSINQEPAFNFTQQVMAMFKRKAYCTIRSRNNIFQIVFPWLYVIFSNFMSANNKESLQQLVIFTMFSLMGFMINTVTYTAFPVWEREQNVKYLLRTMGLQPLPYWLGTFLFDIIPISSYGLVLIPTGYFMGINLLAQTVWNFTLIILCFGFTLLCQSYLLSWLYSKQATVYKCHMALIILGFLYVPLILFFVLVFTVKGGSEHSPFYVFLFGSVASPPVVFLFSCFSLAGFPLITNPENNYFKSFFKYPAFYAVILVFQGLLYFFLNYLLELRSLKLVSKAPKNLQSTIFNDHIPNPQEIHQEEQRVRAEQNQDLTKTIDLEKIYDNGYQGLRGVTFGVEKKQIFGLLGPNGAGKSTTFNILTGLIPKTSGRVIFNGHELQTLHSDIFQNTGICPQFDALWEHLSLAEHLKIVGNIKGLSRLTIDDSISYYAKVLRMQEHLNKKAEQLSGGTKRKLCVANLLIGAPVVQFMDEPSTGLDPLSKRALYDTIVKNLDDRNASIILTTHSMAEAESLCNKIGILINGKFVCLGTLPYLKSRYGTGYKILVVRMNSQPEIYEKRILEAFPGAIKEKDNSEVYDSYRVTTQDFSFEKAFQVMEALKLGKQVSDFNILNTTLEHVFIQFSRNQVESEVRPTTTSSSLG